MQMLHVNSNNVFEKKGKETRCSFLTIKCFFFLPPTPIELVAPLRAFLHRPYEVIVIYEAVFFFVSSARFRLLWRN